MLLGVYYTLSNLEKVDDGDLTVTNGEGVHGLVAFLNLWSFKEKSSVTRTLFFQPSGMVFPTQELKRPTTKSSCLSEWLMVFAILKTSSR